MKNGITVMKIITFIQRYVLLLLPLLLTACQIMPPRSSQNMESITQALNKDITTDEARKIITTPPEVAAALLPTIQPDISAIMPEIQ